MLKVLVPDFDLVVLNAFMVLLNVLLISIIPLIKSISDHSSAQVSPIRIPVKSNTL